MTQREGMRKMLRDWVQFHGFEDDCGYPLISPSDVVLDDLVYRLSYHGVPHDVDKAARERWESVPSCKGTERRLRRRRPQRVWPTDEEALRLCLENIIVTDKMWVTDAKQMASRIVAAARELEQDEPSTVCQECDADVVLAEGKLVCTSTMEELPCSL